MCCLVNTPRPVPLADTLSHRPRNSGEDSRGSEGGGDPAGRHVVWTCCLIATLFMEQVTVTRPGSAGATCQVSDWSRRPKVTSTPDLGRLHGFCSLGLGRQRCRGVRPPAGNTDEPMATSLPLGSPASSSSANTGLVTRAVTRGQVPPVGVAGATRPTAGMGGVRTHVLGARVLGRVGVVGAQWDFGAAFKGRLVVPG